MDDLATRLLALDFKISDLENTSDLAIVYYGKIEWNLNQIRDVLTPRVIQSSKDQQIINALITLDNARTNLQFAKETYHQTKVGNVINEVVELLTALKELLEKLLRKLPP